MKRLITLLSVLIGLCLLVFFLSPRFVKDNSANIVSPDFINIWQRPPAEVSLIAVGDVSFSRAVERIAKRENNINYPFLKMAGYLKSGDIVFANLETPITAGREIADGEMIFRSNPGIEQALRNAGFNIISLANNHTPNFGEKGLRDTFSFLEGAGIAYVGAGENETLVYRPTLLEKNGLRFAFFAYTDQRLVPRNYEALGNDSGTAFMRKEKMVPAVTEAEKKADFVIVSMHSGVEYDGKPDKFQTDFARAAIDAGADLVIGHHPHVVQPQEIYKGKYIFYSLGNFVFDQPWSLPTRQGLAVKIVFSKKGISAPVLQPIIIENFCQPRPVD